MSKFEVIRGVEGCCLALDDTRIAGPKPWGGGTVIHAWETDKEYRAVNTQSRWYELFGTPEKAARTLERNCQNQPACDYCIMADQLPDATCGWSDALLEWLRGDAE